MNKKLKNIKKLILKFLFLFLGSVLTAVGLEIFLIPNNIIDGGVVGISIILSYLTKVPLGAYLIILNIPFLFVGYKQIGKTFVVSSLFSIISLSIWVSVLHPIPVLTNDILLATVFGGIVLGIGVGLIIRYGGSLDGTEIVSIVLSKRNAFSVGEIVMFFNIFILSTAGFVFGWDKAMYSLLAYFIAYKVIDITIEGLDEAKAAYIISDNAEEISSAIMDRLGRTVTLLNCQGGRLKDQKTIIYAVISRLEIAKLKAIIQDKDDSAFVAITDVSDVIGGGHKKNAIH